MFFADIAGFVLVAGLLSACTAPASEPLTTPPPSTSPRVTPSETPSPTPTLTFEQEMLAQVPDAAKGDDLMAALAMGKFFIALQPGLFQGEDPTLFQFLSLPKCMWCSSSVEVTQAEVAKGNVQVGGAYVIPEQVEFATLDLENPDLDVALLMFDVIEEDWDFVDASGSIFRSGKKKTFVAYMELRYVDGLWRVSGVDTRSS